MAVHADSRDGDASVADLTDDDLMMLYRDGTPEAFDLIFGRWRTPVYNFARMMLGEDGMAEEVLQETFLAVARAAPRYEPRGRFRPWLMRIARNHCLNRVEAERVRRETAIALDMRLSEAVSTDAGPVRLLQMKEGMAALRLEITRLPERQREAILLYAMEQMSYQEVAAVLDVPINTVKTLIHRARATLAHTMEHEFEGGPHAL